MSDPRASESVRVYLRFKKVFGDGASRSYAARKRATRDPGASVPFGTGRDPHGLNDVIGALTSSMGWNSSLAQSELMDSWPDVAGEDTARHSSPVGITDGLLTVQCESTAWATQLRLMRHVILNHIIERFPDAGIESIRFQGPDVPSWKRGPRSIPGRGPRDTYG